MLDSNIAKTDLVPKVAQKIDSSRAIQGLPGMPRRLLLIGQVPAGASIERDKVITVSTLTNAQELFNEGSMLMAMFKAAYANLQPGLPVDVVALDDDNTAQAAAGNVLFAGTATAAGQLSLWIAGHSVRVGVAKDDTSVDIVAAIVAEMATMPELPVTGAVNGGDTSQLDLTCNWGGETGNHIDVRVNYYDDELTPQGITATITDMSGGAVNPDLTPVVSAMLNYRATEIVCPYTDSVSMATLEAEAEARWDPNNMQDGQICVAFDGTEGESLAWLDGRNSSQVHSVHTKNALTTPWETAAIVGALVEGQNTLDPGYPYIADKLVGFLPARLEEDFEELQINNLLLEGGSVLTSNSNMGYVLRMVTNYTQTPLGADDSSMRNLNWIKVMSFWRWYSSNEHLKRIGQGWKLSSSDTDPIPGQRIVTKSIAEDFQMMMYDNFIDAGLFEERDYYRSQLLIEINKAQGTLVVHEVPVMLGQHYQTSITSFYVLDMPARTA